MYASDIRKMSDEAILDAIEDQKEALFNLRFQKATGQLEKTARVKEVRRDIARIKTIARQKAAAKA